MTGCELSVVIPALDEGASIGQLVRRVSSEAARLGIAHEVIVVDGGSSDGTPRWAAEAGARVVRQPGRGYADALLFGFRQARGDYVASMDADYSHDPDFLRALWAARHDAELVIASRYVAGGFAYMPVFRRVLSRILNAVSRSVLSLPVARRMFFATSVVFLPSLPVTSTAWLPGGRGSCRAGPRGSAGASPSREPAGAALGLRAC